LQECASAAERHPQDEKAHHESDYNKEQQDRPAEIGESARNGASGIENRLFCIPLPKQTYAGEHFCDL
jgi:hypothetical protein